MESPLCGLINLFKTVVDTADEKMLEIMRSDKSKNIYLAAPGVIITLVNTALIFVSEQGNIESEAETIGLLKRIVIVPSVDWAITLYHKDYSFYKQSWMLRKLALHPPLKSTEGNLNNYVVYVNEAINPDTQRVELN